MPGAFARGRAYQTNSPSITFDKETVVLPFYKHTLSARNKQPFRKIIFLEHHKIIHYLTRVNLSIDNPTLIIEFKTV